MMGGFVGTISGGPIAGTIASVGTIFGTQLAPQFYADFNIENAKALYPNLSENEAIAKLFKENKVPIDLVLSSQWCRCQDTAKYAFENFETFDALNSFYDESFAENETKQINDLKKYIKNWDSDKNLVFVTHYVVISSIFNTGTSSGEIIVSDKNFNILGSVHTM